MTAGIKIAIDRGGTFTDCLGIVPGRKENIVIKLLSVDPTNYADAPTEGIRRILEIAQGESISRSSKIDTSAIESIKMGTTVATNALLERKGTPCALAVTKGFRDLLYIGDQTRPKIFALNIQRPEVLFSDVLEIEERVTMAGFTTDTHPELADIKIDGIDVVKGMSGEPVRILQRLNKEKTRSGLQSLYNKGFRSIAICLVHSYTYQDHELEVARMAQEVGFTQISVSSQLLPLIKVVGRAQSTTADAYLTPEIRRYISGFKKGFIGELDPKKTGTRCEFMQSDGGLVTMDRFNGLRGILSGPAGGVVGYARTCYDEKRGIPLIGFDMGGTSTDVSRYSGTLMHSFENITAGVTIQAPQIDINTVAAGGGSILFWKQGLFVVGPESAGAHPGPACYRKGGPLTVTDANLFLGILLPEYFPKIFGENEDQPLDTEIVRQKFTKLAAQIVKETGVPKTPEEVAWGYLKVANECMCRPIRALTEAQGFNTSDHELVVFGGAGGQHGCAIAETLKINRVIVHKYSSILSAYGMALADVVHEMQEPLSGEYSSSSTIVKERVDKLISQIKQKFLQDGIDLNSVRYNIYLNLRYHGSDTSLMISKPPDGEFSRSFEEEHRREFTFAFPGRKIFIEDIRVQGVGKSGTTVPVTNWFDELESLKESANYNEKASAFTSVFFEDAWTRTSIYFLKTLQPGVQIKGPALILDDTQTIFVAPSAIASILSEHVIIDLHQSEMQNSKDFDSVLDPVLLSVFGNRFMSIAEQMGRTLQKTSVSVNIKERLDFSCALFGPDGGLVANAPHVPVHLGSMEYAIKFQHEKYFGKLKPGDVLMSNHPVAGGTHLPDITVISPIFGENGEIVFYVASRGHHSELGGILPGSMPSSAVALFEEGAAFESFFLVRGGVFDEEGVRKLLVDDPAKYPGCSGSRRLKDNISDLQAQIAANARGARLLKSLIKENGLKKVHFYMREIKRNAEIAVRRFLKGTYEKFQGKPLEAVDFMDDGTPLKVKITINPDDGTALLDWTGTGCETFNCFNAPTSVTRSAALYVMRCLINEEIPLNEGCLTPLEFNIPLGTILNPSSEAAVCAGNPITSQRITDVLFKAFDACAASQGDCNVFHFGTGGMDSNGKLIQGFAYGETICGGSGAGESWHGTSATQVHMTNTRITDPEFLEKRFPVVLRQFKIREDSGGKGLFNGGNGVIREIEFLQPLSVTVLSERRVHHPYGLHGGQDGATGKNYYVRKLPDGKELTYSIGPRKDWNVNINDRVIICTPGGGGWGTTDKSSSIGNGGLVKEPISFAPSGSVSLFNSMQETA